MGVLLGLEPQKVFYWFEEITKIPHGSGNVGRISDFLVEFAESRNLAVTQDALKNVIMVGEATPGYEKEPTVILQGHMDMVAVKKPESAVDLQTEGLRVGVEGDNIYAEGTSLGGDDGIAVAYALAILDSDDIPHPRLEVVITVDEEVGMDGAAGIDLSALQGNRLLNLDSEEEGIFLTSCAGGARVNCRLPLERSMGEGRVLTLQIDGLLGGHSGEEIHKGRGNANLLLGRVLWALAQKYPLRLVSISGGLADNAIPRTAEAVFLVEDEEVTDLLQKLREDIAGELAVRDPGFDMRWTIGERRERREAVPAQAGKGAFAMLAGLPNGVQSMSAQVPGLVETSLNLGILCFADGILTAEFSVRSSVESAKEALIGQLRAILYSCGGNVEVSGDYPGWKYRADSPFREKMIRVFRKMYGRDPELKAIHAGLECGILGSKIPDPDCVSIGPDMKDIHTTEETLSISSTARVWEYLLALLAEKEA
ncbi:MAG: aminoacyl-histidine dipeptidase [Clostridium sp.]|nr:aminoacyl-histidine dipeptidase [Acetatifactor muris]MCM1528247.1 aminoacyl-histidine dipeptidase [Bacteroides sp.]MCM1562139.1 aminoacyl-histidine dipeptidase [Clostridium sp.]